MMVAVAAYVIRFERVKAGVFPSVRRPFFPRRERRETAFSPLPFCCFLLFLRERESREWLLEVD